ncbi:MAG: fatty acid desaturase [Candidatus Eremiobacteraeota bacterium]|nr:fatty acid desaturase [Candidatus Eremiobacteraeota bacterium]
MKLPKEHWINGIGLGLIHLVALAAFLPAFFHWSSVAIAAGIYILTGGLGITLCYHRTLTHRSIRLRKPLEYALAIFGTLAFQGDPIKWVAIHRKHHAHADKPGDPHSIAPGFSWAHMEWIYRRNEAVPSKEEIIRFVPDLYADPFYRVLAHIALPLQIVLAAVLFLCGGWSLVIWGIFARLVFSFHSTWLVNSAAHTMGYRTYRTDDRSTNNWLVALLSFGEGWHNNHHAFPYSARHGMHWYEIDTTWWCMQVLVFTGLADRLKVPSKAVRQRLLLPGRNAA